MVITSRFHSNDRVVAFSGLTCRIEVSGEETDQRVTVIEMTAAAGAGAPRHISHREDKCFRVIKGRFRFSIDGDERDVEANETIVVARGAAHSFSNLSDDPAVLLLVSSPAGHDGFFRDLAALSLPHAPEAVAEVCARHGQELL